MRRKLSIITACVVAAGALASPALAAPDGTPPAAAAGGVQLTRVCGTGKDKHELVTRSGRRSSCRSALSLMRGWRNKDNPRRYHGFRCGDVPGANVGFARGDRWFASWQCRDKTATYRVWTRY